MADHGMDAPGEEEDGFGFTYVWDEGYLGWHWKRYNSVYDSKLGIYRCPDEKGELIKGMESACIAMTLRGQSYGTASEGLRRQRRGTGGLPKGSVHMDVGTATEKLIDVN